jgi:enediyne biosynthesis protein E4
MTNMTRLILTLAVLAAPALAQDASLTVPSFVDEGTLAGIDHSFTGGWEFMVGGGVATFDCDDDGRTDMVMAGGTAPAQLYRNTSAQGGALAFEAVASGLEVDGVSGAYALDLDSDGVQDVILLRVGDNLAMRGLGDCTFERANELWGFDGGDAWSTSLAATWEQGGAWPTIAIGNYIDRTQEAFPWGNCTDNWLHRPDPQTGIFAPPLALTPSFCTLSMLFTDWDGSGRADLRVSNDREYYKGGEEQLWHVPPGAAPRLYTADEGWQRLRIWGMGIASRDLDGNGAPEYFLTSMADNKLQTLTDDAAMPRKPEYSDMAYARGATAHMPYTGGETRPSTAWHAQFEDVNNDGLADLFVAKGNVWEMPDFAMLDPNNLLLQRADGTFEEAGDRAGVASLHASRGAGLADFNNDGLVDLVVVNRNGPTELWRNVTTGAGHWLALRLSQPAPNRDAIGGWIELRLGDRLSRREISVGGGHAGGHAGWWHEGVGARETVEVRVIWPDGEEGPWQGLATNVAYVMERGKPALPVTR